MIVTDQRVSRFVSDVVGKGFVPPFTCMGIEKNGEIIAGVIFNVFEGNDVHFSAAGKGWTKGFLAEVGDYVFRQLKCERMTALTEQEKVMKLALRLGGQVEGKLRNHFGAGRDAILIGILKDDYPW
ncbi:MAG: GNAT family N-acetyltransferase [Candidatus Ochrobactrum gambitense]|nr:MAG: GNAT family N-acetyltransferase [Candidatus Ochrobactrum gambitense]WEK17223.1 MAG: GNAT family protein [Candidatus Ochrobactrum gambitense]